MACATLLVTVSIRPILTTEHNKAKRLAELQSLVESADHFDLLFFFLIFNSLNSLTLDFPDAFAATLKRSWSKQNSRRNVQPLPGGYQHTLGLPIFLWVNLKYVSLMLVKIIKNLHLVLLDWTVMTVLTHHHKYLSSPWPILLAHFHHPQNRQNCLSFCLISHWDVCDLTWDCSLSLYGVFLFFHLVCVIVVKCFPRDAYCSGNCHKCRTENFDRCLHWKSGLILSIW